MLNLQTLHAIADGCPYDFGGQVLVLSNEDGYGFIGQGGDLTTSTLLHAYRCGAFPWFDNEPIAWWSPNPRCVIDPLSFTPKKSLIRTARKSSWMLTTNYAFEEVINACREPRAYTDETWIGGEMVEAYVKLHKLGVAVSIEVWQGKPIKSPLIGGLYGINIGAAFCGESMFHRITDSSKVAFWGLMKLCQGRGIGLVDCQLKNPHLMSLGATLMGRQAFLAELDRLNKMDVAGLGAWRFCMPVLKLAEMI